MRPDFLTPHISAIIPFFASSRKRIAFATIAVGLCSLQAHAVTIDYDGSDTSLLAPNPLGGGSLALFPGASLTDNRINMSGGIIEGDVLGGVNANDTDLVADNVVIITGGEIFGAAYGGRNAYIDATNNTVVVSGGTMIQEGIYGGAVHYGSGSANNNTVRVTDNANIFSALVGGYVDLSGSANNNRVHVHAQGSRVGDVYGALLMGGNGSANGNSVDIAGAMVYGNIYGSYVSYGSGSANNNAVQISRTTYTDRSVFGAHSDGHTTGNSVEISGDSFIGEHVYGGHSNVGVASDNTVEISGGTIGKNVYGGSSGTADAIYNTVILSDPADLTESEIYGGYSVGTGDLDLRTGNTLKIQTNKLVVKGVHNFQKYHFYVSNEMVGGAPLLTITESELVLLENDILLIDLAGLTGSLGLYETLHILFTAAGLVDGAENLTWLVQNYNGQQIEDYELTAFWQDDMLQVGWTSAVPEPSAFALIFAVAAIGFVLMRRKRTMVA